MPSLELFWGGASIPQSTGRDQAIAEGAELDELGYGDYSDDSDSDNEPDYYNPQTGEHSYRRQSREVAIRKAKRRVPGGIAPIQKKISTDYDSDDARIVELKQQLYSDEYVANKLKEEGRMRYTPKTICSRWLRLRRLLEEKEEQKLDDELSDWHVGEDDIVKSIFDDLEEKYQQQRVSLETKKWKEVSAHLAEKLGKKKYTGNACRERYEAVMKGTALPPIELDEDQAGRRKMREDRIAAARKARADVENAKRQVEKDKKDRLETKKREQAEANQLKVIKELKRKSEKEERERIKEERQVNKEKARLQKVHTLGFMRLQRDWEMEKKRGEKRIYRQLTGADVDGKAARPRSKKNGYESDDEDEPIDDLESDEEEAQMNEDEEEVDIMSEDEDEPMVEDPTFVRRSARKSRRPSLSTRPPAVSVQKPFHKAQVTEQTLLNPRSVMDDDELDCLLHFRGLLRRQNETHAEVVARLAAADQELKWDELSQYLAHASEKAKGRKVNMIRLLQTADAKKSRMGEMGLTSTDVEFMETYEAYKEDEYRAILDQARKGFNVV